MFLPTSIRRVRHLPLMWWGATLVVAVSAGLLVFGSVDRAAGQAAKYSDSVDVFVATDNITAGVSIANDDFEPQRRPVAFTPVGPLPQQVPAGRVASRDIEAGEVLTQSNLAPGGSGPVAALLQPHERAVEVETPEARLDARPGDRVDVIGTFDNAGQSEALILARSARILATSAGSVTVAVPEVETPAVAAAASQRRVTIAMSGPGAGDSAAQQGE